MPFIRGAAHGDAALDEHRAAAPDMMGPNRPGPKGYAICHWLDGLDLGGAGCHGDSGITFIPGYNAGYQVLDDLGSR